METVLASGCLYWKARGLIAGQKADGKSRRLGLGQIVFARAKSVGMRTIRTGGRLDVRCAGLDLDVASLVLSNSSVIAALSEAVLMCIVSSW